MRCCTLLRGLKGSCSLCLVLCSVFLDRSPDHMTFRRTLINMACAIFPKPLLATWKSITWTRQGPTPIMIGAC